MCKTDFSMITENDAILMISICTTSRELVHSLDPGQNEMKT